MIRNLIKFPLVDAKIILLCKTLRNILAKGTFSSQLLSSCLFNYLTLKCPEKEKKLAQLFFPDVFVLKIFYILQGDIREPEWLFFILAGCLIINQEKCIGIIQ